VKRRFRLYQVLQILGNRRLTQSVFKIFKGESETLPQEYWELLSDYNFLHENGELYKFKNKNEFENYLKAHPTK